jgi:hypothetical protein
MHRGRNRVITTALLAASAAFLLFAAAGVLAQEDPPPALLYDFSGDGCVDGKDMILLGLRYGCCKAPDTCPETPGCEETPCADDACYDATFDVGPLDSETSEPAPDGTVNATDLQLLLGEFGQGCS